MTCKLYLAQKKKPLTPRMEEEQEAVRGALVHENTSWSHNHKLGTEVREVIKRVKTSLKNH
jgi:hypothetical protein